MRDYDDWVSADPQDEVDRRQRRRDADLERGEQISDEISSGEREPYWPYRLKLGD